MLKLPLALDVRIRHVSRRILLKYQHVLLADLPHRGDRMVLIPIDTGCVLKLNIEPAFCELAHRQKSSIQFTSLEDVHHPNALVVNARRAHRPSSCHTNLFAVRDSFRDTFKHVFCSRISRIDAESCVPLLHCQLIITIIESPRLQRQRPRHPCQFLSCPCCPASFDQTCHS